MFNEQLQNLISTFKEKSHAQATNGEKRLALVECEIKGDTLKWLMGLKYGKLTETTFALDGKDDSDVLMSFKVLGGQDVADVDEEMIGLMETKKFMPMSLMHNIYKTSKLLARANKGDPHEMTEAQFRKVLPCEMLLALGRKYNHFLLKNSPALESFGQEQFDEIMAALDECEGSLGKMRTTLGGLSFPVMLEMVVEQYLQTKALSAQLEKSFTGQ